MKVGIGYNRVDNSHKAGEEAAKKAIKDSGHPVLTFLFTTDAYEQSAVFEAVKGIVGCSKIVGFCCGGIITQDGVFTQGVGVCTLSGDELEVATSLQKGLSQEPYKVGRQGGEELLKSGIKGGTIFAFPDGFSANIQDMLRGLYDNMGSNFKYIGGGSGDNLRFFKTYQCTEEGISSDALSLALVSGIKIQIALGHGWRPIGPPLIIGNISGKKVIEIDGKSAFDAYCDRLGEIPLDKFPEYGMKYPLGFPNISGDYLIRDPLKVNPDKSIDFVTEVLSNSVGYIMKGRAEDLISSSGTVAKMAVQKLKKPKFALCFDCISRYLLMGKEFEKELEAIRSSIGILPILGALTFGEIGAYEQAPLFHNKTTVIAVGG